MLIQHLACVSWISIADLADVSAFAEIDILAAKTAAAIKIFNMFFINKHHPR